MFWKDGLRSFSGMRAHCLVCGELFDYRLKESLACVDCLNDLPCFPDDCCPISGAPNLQKYLLSTYGVDDLKALFKYDGIIRELILGYKFHSNPYHFRFLRYLLRQAFFVFKDDFLEGHDLLCIVPSHPVSILKRGYNPVARLLQGLCPIQFDASLLKKEKYLPPMISLNASERKRLRKGRIFGCEKNISGKSVLLFDDVMTTGTTLYNVVKALRKANVSRVSVVVMARNLKNVLPSADKRWLDRVTDKPFVV